MPRKIENFDDPSHIAAEIGVRSHIANESLLAMEGGSAQVAERLEPGTDMFTIDELTAKELGIDEKLKAGWKHAWIRDDRYWNKHVGSNRFQQWRRENPGGEMVTVNGQPYSMGEDIVLVLKPPETVAAQDAAWKAHEAAFFKDMESERRKDDFPDDERSQKRIAKENSLAHMKAGMIGPASKTEGMSLEEAYRIQFHRMNEREMGSAIESEELKWARGGRAYVDRQEAPPETRSGGTTYSIPSSVRPKNLAKA